MRQAVCAVKQSGLTQIRAWARIFWEAEVAQVVEHLTENQGVSGSTPLLGTAEVAEWQTRQSQKLLGGNPRVGSSPTFGTTDLEIRTGYRKK